MAKLNLQKLRKECSNIPILHHHNIEFSHGKNKHKEK